MVDNVGIATIPKQFFYGDSYEHYIKYYLKLIFHTLLEKTSNQFNLPSEFVESIKYYIDFSLESQWDNYLILFGYIQKVLLILGVNFLFGYGSPFTINDYFTFSKILIRFINSLLFITFNISLNFILSSLKILFLMILIFYEFSKSFLMFLEKICHYIISTNYPSFLKIISAFNFFLQRLYKTFTELINCLDSLKKATFSNKMAQNSSIKKKGLLRLIFENKNLFCRILLKRAFVKNEISIQKKSITDATSPNDLNKDKDQGFNIF